MAERPGELGEFDTVKVDRIPVVATEHLENVHLENSQEVTENISDDPDQIRENIEETRAEMSETLDAIQEKLSFSNISEQVKAEVSEYVGETLQTAKDSVSEYVGETIQSAKDSVYDATFGKVGDVMNYVDKGINEMADTKIVKTARQNPLALGLIGLGLGLLYFGGKKESHSKFRYDESYEPDERNYRRGYSSTSGGQSTFSSAKDAVSGAASKVGDSVSSAAGTVSETVGNVAGAVSETAGDVAGKAYQQVGNIGSKAQDFAGSAQDNYEYYMDENPLAVGAVALALGAAVGLAIPSTKVENQYMGEARNNLLQKAESTARDTVEKVQQVAGQVKETVKEEAKNQGLT